MAEQSAPVKLADTPFDGPVNDVALEGMTPTVETIQAFACEIAQMSEEALDRMVQHVENLRRADHFEKAAAIQADFLKEAMEHAVQHTRNYIEMLATFPHELVWPVNVAVEMAEAARHATAAKVERLHKVADRA